MSWPGWRPTDRAHRAIRCGRPASAVPGLRRAINKDPQNSYLHSLLARSLRDAGRFDEAYSAIEDGITTAGESISLIAERALLHLATGSPELGKIEAQRARELAFARQREMPGELRRAFFDDDEPDAGVGLQTVASIVPSGSFGYAVHSPLLSSVDRREAFDCAFEGTQSNLAEIERAGMIDDSWSIFWGSAVSFYSDSLSPHLYLAFQLALLDRVVSRLDGHGYAVAIHAPIGRRQREIIAEHAQSLGLQVLKSGRDVPRLQYRRSWAPEATIERYSEKLPKRSLAHLAGHVGIALASGWLYRGLVRLRLSRIPDHPVLVNVKIRRADLSSSFSVADWMAWRLRDSIDPADPRVIAFFEHGKGLDVGATERMRLAFRLALAKGPEFAICVDALAPARTLLRASFRARAASRELQRSLSALTDQGGALQYTLVRARDRVHAAAFLHAVEVREGFAALARLVPTRLAVNADAISKEQRLWIDVARRLGIVVLYASDRVLTGRRSSNLPPHGCSFADGAAVAPTVAAVFDWVSADTLASNGLPATSVRLLAREGSRPNAFRKLPSPDSPVVVLYLQSYIDDMGEMLFGTLDAATEAGYGRLIVRLHPQFGLNDAVMNSVAMQAPPRMDVSFSMSDADIDVRPTVVVSGYSTACLAPALAGIPVIWLAHLVTNEMVASDYTRRFGVRTGSDKEFVSALEQAIRSPASSSDPISGARELLPQLGDPGVTTLRELIEELAHGD